MKEQDDKKQKIEEERDLFQISDAPSSSADSKGPGSNNSSGTGQKIDFARAGRKIAEKRFNLHKRNRGHLDVVPSLDLLEKVWMLANDGLEEDEFVDFLASVLEMPRDELSVLFEKVDADNNGDLSWDEFLSYLLREVTHKWQFRSARGTFLLKETDTPPFAVNNQVQQILVLPGESGSHGRYFLSCKDNSIQVWNSQTMTHMSNIPLRQPGMHGDADSNSNRRRITGAIDPFDNMNNNNLRANRQRRNHRELQSNTNVASVPLSTRARKLMERKAQKLGLGDMNIALPCKCLCLPPFLPLPPHPSLLSVSLTDSMEAISTYLAYLHVCSPIHAPI